MPGQITKWTQQAGATPPQAFDFGNDAVGQLKSATLKDAAQTILKSYNYDYDAGGNRSLEAIDSLVTDETANNLNQLKTRQAGAGQLPIRGTTSEATSSVTVNGSPAIVRNNTFEGKAAVTAGNNPVTVVATDVNGNATTNRYNVVVTGSGTKTLAYDANGNPISDGTRNFEWDPLDRLTAVTSGTQRSEFTYNGAGQRVTIVEKDSGTVTSTKNFISVGSEICEERDGSNNVIKRFYAQGVQVGTSNYYFTRDHLGSVRELTDDAGAVQTRYDYDPYGRRSKVSGSVDADFGFTGHYYHQPTGLHQALYRAYDADLGRWISRDPIGEAGPDGPNLYSYVRNNPVNRLDPLGLDSYWMDVSDTMYGFLNGYFDVFDWLPDDPCEEEFNIGSGIGDWTDRALGLKGLAKTGIKAGLGVTAQNPSLLDAIRNLYRPGAKIGSGSSMDAYRFEQTTGQLLSPTGHGQKLLDRRAQLQKVLRDPSLTPSDRQTTKTLLIDIQAALGGQ